MNTLIGLKFPCMIRILSPLIWLNIHVKNHRIACCKQKFESTCVVRAYCDVFEDLVTLCSSCLCFSKASSRLKPNHSASSSGISNCCSDTGRQKRNLSCFFCAVADTCRGMSGQKGLHSQQTQCHSVNTLELPCICCRPSLSSQGRWGKALCFCVPGEAALPSSGPSPVWNSGLPLTSDKGWMDMVSDVWLYSHVPSPLWEPTHHTWTNKICTHNPHRVQP